MHDIERELIKVTKYKVQRKFSDRQDYLKSIFNAAQKLSDQEFDDLTDDTASWLNDCVQIFNAKRDAELPDFDEVSDDQSAEENPDDEGEAETKEPSQGDAGDDVNGSDGDDEIDEPVEPAPEKSAKKLVTPKIPKPVKKKTPKDEPPPEYEDDAVLDKWGCIVGSKNAMALALFEKGATTREVKEKIGGTYYNIMGKMEQRGHKVEKEGNLIKITHRSEVLARKPKK